MHPLCINVLFCWRQNFAYPQLFIGVYMHYFVLCLFIYLFIFMAEYYYVVLFILFFMVEHHGFVPLWSWHHIKINDHQNYAICLCWFCTAKTNVFGCLVSFNNTNRHKSSTNKHQFREIWMALGGEWRHCPGLCLLFLKRGNIYDVHFNGTNKWHQYCAI